MRNPRIFAFVGSSALIAVVASAMAQDEPPRRPPVVDTPVKAKERLNVDTPIKGNERLDSDAYVRQDKPADGPPSDVIRRTLVPEPAVRYIVNPQPPEPPVSPGDVEDVDAGGPPVYGKYMRQLFRVNGEQPEGRDPEGVLNSKAQVLLRKLEAAKEQDKRNTIIEELRGVINQQFEQRLDRQAREVQALEAKVKKLKELIDKRVKNRDDIVARKLEQLIRDSEGLGF